MSFLCSFGDSCCLCGGKICWSRCRSYDKRAAGIATRSPAHGLAVGLLLLHHLCFIQTRYVWLMAIWVVKFTKYYRVLAKIDLLQGSYCTLWIDRVESSKIGYYYRKIKCFKIIVIKIVNKKVCSYWMILFDFVSLSSKIENPYCHNICNHNVHLFHMFDLLIDHDLERDAVRYY